jgi:hypothetical protein
LYCFSRHRVADKKMILQKLKRTLDSFFLGF